MLLSPSATLLGTEAPASPSSTPRGSRQLSSVAYVAWVVFLAALVALCTLAPSVIVLQSMQRHAAAAAASLTAADRSPAGLNPEALMALQHSRHMRAGRKMPAADCQRAHAAFEQAHAQKAAPEQRSGTSVPAPSAAAADADAGQPAQQLQQQQEVPMPAQQPPQLDPVHGLPADLVRRIGPVDVVYLWVNGSDPVLGRELQQYEAAAAKARAAPGPGEDVQDAPWDPESPVRQARFDAGRDELRYSLRSLEMYMPWFNRVFIVTNGQIPTWLKPQCPRVTIVPHSSIFQNPTHLPTFNSLAIQANIANIPGLSETFVMLDDDFFLTVPWTLADFIGPDGGQILTGSTLVSKIKPAGNLYLRMTTHSNKVFDEHFGHHKRYDPAHAPRLVHKRYLKELQEKLPQEFEQTSAAQARSAQDLMVPSAYMWYVSQFQPGQHPTAPDDRTAFTSIGNAEGHRFLYAAMEDFHNRLEANDTAAKLHKSRHETEIGFLQLALEFETATRTPGPKTLAAGQRQLYKLISSFSQPRAKMVCLNDDVPEDAAIARPLGNAVVRQFLESRYSGPSQFELLYEHTNNCIDRLPLVPFGKLPAAADYQAACKPRTAAAKPAAQPAAGRPATQEPSGPMLADFVRPPQPRAVVA